MIRYLFLGILVSLFFINTIYCQNIILIEEGKVKLKNNYEKWDKNINMSYENYMIQWNGNETIRGNSLGNGVVSALPIYQPLPGNKKATLCGNLYMSAFFADDLSSEFEPDRDKRFAKSVAEELLKIDCDLNIPLKPNLNYELFWNYPRQTFKKLEMGYEGEVQIDDVKYPKATTVVQKSLDNVEEASEDVANWFLATTGSTKTVDINSTDFYAGAEIVKKRNSQYYKFWKDLTNDKSICIFGPLTYDLLNSKYDVNKLESLDASKLISIAPSNRKTEIHPVEQFWYKHHETGVVFGKLVDKSLRFTAISKNTNETPWVTTKSRKFAIPFAFSVNPLFIEGHDLNISRYPTNENINTNLSTKLSLRYKFKNGDEVEVLNLKADDDSPLKYSIEDVFIDSSKHELKLLRGMLVIENKGVNNIFRWTSDFAYDPKYALKMAKFIAILKERKEAKKRAIESAIKTISKSDVLMVKSAFILKTHNNVPANLFKIVIVPQDGQILDGYTLVKDENISMMTSGVKLENNKNKSAQSNLIFSNVMLKSEVLPLYVTIEKNSIKRKVYFDE